MEPDILQYERIVEEALRGVVRTALSQVADFGLPGDHSLYITFLTGHDDVAIPDRLRASYPEDMTIVLEHQFWDLAVSDEHFEVTLSFNRRKEHLVVPFAAVTSFADPSVPFGLKFELGTRAAEEAGEASEGKPTEGDEPTESDEAEKPGEVVNLDSFRKNR